MYVQKAPVCSDPQSAIPIPKELCGAELPPNSRNLVRLRLPANELPDSDAGRDQRRTAISFDQVVGLVSHLIDFRSSSLQSPETVRRYRPQIASTILT